MKYRMPTCVWGTHAHALACTGCVRRYEDLVRLRPRFCGEIDALGQNPSQSGPKRQGGGGTTAYVARPHAPAGAPTVGAACIGRGRLVPLAAVPAKMAGRYCVSQLWVGLTSSFVLLSAALALCPSGARWVRWLSARCFKKVSVLVCARVGSKTSQIAAFAPRGRL